MAAESTFNEPDTSADETSDEQVSSFASNPPRPPRPARRPGALARMPMPAPASRSGGYPFGSTEDIFDSSPASPAVPIEDDDVDGPALPLTPSRARAASPLPPPDESPPLPEESFADLANDVSDRAPSAPLTPWRNVPPLVEAPAVEAAPVGARSDPDSSPPVGIDPDEDREDTIVGEVNRNLLELSGSGDENTRAYTAPQELIELAKRKREERLRAKNAAPVPPEAHSKETERPPALRRTPGARAAEESLAARATALSPNKLPSAFPGDEDAAPAIARANSVPADRPSASGSERISSALLELAAVSKPTTPSSAPAVSEVIARADASPESVAMSISNYKTPWLSSPPRWVLLAVVFVVVGFALSRWRGIEQLIQQLLQR